MLIDSYGGHFLDMQNSVQKLLVEKEMFSAMDGLSPISNDIKKCMNQYGNTTQILRQMAQRGFAPVYEYDDPAVEMIVKMNIGGIVQSAKSTIIGLPRSIWTDYPNVEFGLVPTSESARILIAKMVLAQEAKEAIAAQEAKEAIAAQEAKEAIAAQKAVLEQKDKEIILQLEAEVAMLKQKAKETWYKRWWKRLIMNVPKMP
jgi:hypothetical protein